MVRWIAGVLALGLSAAPTGIWLDVPFVRQEKNGCGAASISMVVEYWIGKGAQLDAERADPIRIQRALFAADAEGIRAAEMVRYFEDQGFRAVTFQGAWADLKQHLAAGRPVIVCLREGSRRAPLHYLVIAGLDFARDLVLVNDPAQRKLMKMNRAAFDKGWSGAGNWALLAVPKAE